MNILEFLLGDSLWAHVLSAFIIIVCGYLVGKLLKLLLVLIQMRLAKRTKNALDDHLLNVLANSIGAFALLFTAYWTTSALNLSEETDLIQRLGMGINAAFYVMMMLYAAFVISRMIDTVILWYLKAVASRTDTKLDDELAPLINRILKILVFVIAIIIILDHFNQNVSTLVVSLGVGSLAIALAAQETLANMIAGFVLMIDRPFRVGDRVRLGDGTFGNVAEIGIRSTKVIDDNNIMIITPNAEIVKSQIWNLSYPNDIVRFRMPFSVAYGTDISFMRKVILEAVNAEPDIIEPETSEVRVLALGSSSVDAEVICKINDPNRINPRRAELLQLVYETLRKNKIEIPFPQRVLHLAPSAEKAIAGTKES